jgi:hypothetical protein
MKPVVPSLAALLTAVAAASCGSGDSSNAGPGGPGGGDDASSSGSSSGGAGHDAGRDAPGDSASSDSGSSHDGGTGKDGGMGMDSGQGNAPMPPPQVPNGWHIALDDEFEGSTLGPNWSVGTNLTSFVDNGTTYWNPYQPKEAEYLTGSMVAIQNSNLILSTEASNPVSGPYGSKSFIAGYVTSYGKFDFQYGYIEFRMEMPGVAQGAMTGLWPALWLLNSTYANPDEIDVLESFGGDQTAIQMTAQPMNAANTTITPGYHILGVLHTATNINFYVDNQLLQAFTQSMSSKMAILMGLQLGSTQFGWLPGPMPANWPGGINGAMTADFKVDWVHVWTP